MSTSSNTPQENNKNYKVPLIVLGLLIGFVVIMELNKGGDFFAKGYNNKANTTPASPNLDSITDKRTEDYIKAFEAENEKKQAEEEKKQKALIPLKKNFTFKKDEFNGSGWYTHKTFNSSSNYRKTLKAHVNENGFIYLESQWYDDDWLFHTYVQVKVGESVLTTPVVETFNKNNVHHNDGGVVWETISYVEDGDNGILSSIANAKGPVKVRFVGDKFYRDITLPEKDKKAIKDCYELSEAIKAL